MGCEETPQGGIDPSNSVRLIEAAESADAVLIGPGMIDKSAVAALTKALLCNISKAYIILDAVAITEMRGQEHLFEQQTGRLVITPHAGEMAKFLGSSREEIDANPGIAAKEAARNIRGVVALKGASTKVVEHLGQELLSDHGSIGLGTSGSGDTLAGILVGLLARGASPLLATAWAVYLHAEAGRRLSERDGAFGLLAREIPGEIPRIMAELADADYHSNGNR